MKSELTGAVGAPSPIDTSFKVGQNDGTRNAQARRAESPEPPGPAKVPNTRVFGEASENLAKSAPPAASHAPSDHGSAALDADAELPALQIPADLRTAMTDLVAGDEASGAGQEVQLRSSASIASIEDVPSPAGDDAVDAAETGSAGRPDTVETGDQVISLASRAASALAAAADTSIFGAVALGGAANMADFLAPAVVDGIEDPLTRSVAAAGFSGLFLGLTASVTTALGEDIAQRITENRITEKEPEGDVSRGSQLWSAVKNQTIPAYIGFSAAFVTANALDADSGKLGDTDVNTETVLLKLGRATVGGVAYGLAKEAAKSFSDHSLTKNEADRVLDNTRKLGEAIKNNVTSLPQAMSAYTRPTEKGAATEFGNVLGAAFGFASFAAINGAVTGALQSTFGEDTGEVMSEPGVQAAIATAAGVAGFVIADQLARNIYANVVPVREAPDAADESDAGDVEISEIEPDVGSDNDLVERISI